MAMFLALFASGFLMLFTSEFNTIRWLMILSGCILISYLWFGIRWFSGEYLPEKWEFSFIKFSLKYQKGKIAKEYDLREATELLFRLTETRHSSHLSKPSHYYTYNGIIILLGISGEKELIIGQTGELREQRDQAYKDGIAFSSMITGVLKIPFKFEDQTW